MERAENKKKPWMKYRHRVVRDIAYAVMYPYTRLKYNIKIDKFKEQGNRPYLILMNHQTAFDQFFVGMAFRGPVYYVASEDLFSNGWISSLLRWLVAPIPIKKQTSDVGAVKNCIRVAREGGTIAIAPGGQPHIQRPHRLYEPRHRRAGQDAEAADSPLPHRGRLRRAPALERRREARQDARLRLPRHRAGGVRRALQGGAGVRHRVRPLRGRGRRRRHI